MKTPHINSIILADRICSYVDDCSLEDLIKLYNQLFKADIKVENVYVE